MTVSGSAQATAAHYDYAGGGRVGAQFSPPNGAKGWVELNFIGSGSKIKLPRVLSVDGARYAGNGIEFWIVGRTAKLNRGGASETCTTD